MKKTTAALAYGVGSSLVAWGIITAFGVDPASAQSVANTRPPMASTPQTVNGFVTMTSGLMVDGGVTTSMVKADSGDFQNLYVDGGTSLNGLEVSGTANFRNRPGGVFVLASLTKAASLTVGVGCSTLGTVSVSGMEPNVNACTVASLPAAALNLGVTYDCYVTASGVVTVRACGLVALVAAPAGIYRLVISGPAS